MIMINVTESWLPPKIMTCNIWRCSAAVWSYIADLKFCAYRNDPKPYRSRAENYTTYQNRDMFVRAQG